MLRIVRIVRPRAASRVLGIWLCAAMLAGCARDRGEAELRHEPVRAGRASVGATDEAHRRLAERCLFDLSARANPSPDAAPQCRCYAHAMLQKMSPAQIHVVAAGDAGLPVYSGGVLASCANRIAAARGHGQESTAKPVALSDDESATLRAANQAPAAANDGEKH
jgi:hypothetical protein